MSAAAAESSVRTPSAPRRNAVLVPVTFEILCPHELCNGTVIPSPAGAARWSVIELRQVEAEQRTLICTGCHQALRLPALPAAVALVAPPPAKRATAGTLKAVQAIRAEMVRLEVSVARLARLSGLSESTLLNLFAGRAESRSSTLDKIWSGLRKAAGGRHAG